MGFAAADWGRPLLAVPDTVFPVGSFLGVPGTTRGSPAYWDIISMSVIGTLFQSSFRQIKRENDVAMPRLTHSDSSVNFRSERRSPDKNVPRTRRYSPNYQPLRQGKVLTPLGFGGGLQFFPHLPG